MFGRKFKFLCLGLSGCVFQLQFLGCSQEFAEVVLRSFTPAFGDALGTALGTSLGAPLIDFAAIADFITGLNII